MIPWETKRYALEIAEIHTHSQLYIIYAQDVLYLNETTTTTNETNQTEIEDATRYKSVIVSHITPD